MKVGFMDQVAESAEQAVGLFSLSAQPIEVVRLGVALMDDFESRGVDYVESILNLDKGSRDESRSAFDRAVMMVAAKASHVRLASIMVGEVEH